MESPGSSEEKRRGRGGLFQDGYSGGDSNKNTEIYNYSGEKMEYNTWKVGYEVFKIQTGESTNEVWTIS